MTSLLKDAQDTFYLYAISAGMSMEEQDKIEDVWIKKYFYASCKETLARVRGKFGGKLSIPGSDLKLDYESLLIEAGREKCFLKYAIFKEKEILKCVQIENAVFVFYINVRNVDEKDVEEYIRVLTDKFQQPGFTNYFIPIRDGETRVECIYPVSEELDEQGKHVIKRFNDYLDELTKNKEDDEQQD
jgi:hypothetical protein